MLQIHYVSRITSRIVLITLGALVTLGATVASANEVAWSTNIADSLRRSAAVGKPVLMEFTAGWCVYCKRMEKTTFADPTVVATVGDHFVPVQIDADQYKDLVKQLQIKGLPAILIVSPDLTILERISGFQTPEALLKKLERFKKVSAAPESAVQFAEVQRPPSKSSFDVPVVAASQASTRQTVTVPGGQPQQHATIKDGLPHVDLFANADASAEAARETGANPFAPETFETSHSARPATRQPMAATADPAESNPFAESKAASNSLAPNPFDETATSGGQQSAAVASRKDPFGGDEFSWNSAAPDPATSTSPAQPPTAATSSNPFQLSGETQPVKTPAAAAKLSFGGVCMVSALDDREIIPGNKAVTAIYRGKLVAFQSEEYRARFQANPDKYWPMMDGVCAVTLAETGKQIQGKFEYASIFRNRIWLFTSEENMSLFLEEPAEMVEEALEQL